ncbi:MAG: site-2 protease family protein [Candidatus Kariarchaeaceae archaeon]|jgi:membrane-associated protease RseP (regulator of RpoE activity)
MATSEGVKVEKTGFMLILVIFTMFLQNTITDLEKISKRAKLRIISTGVITSLLVALILLPLLTISGSLLAPFYGESSGALVIGIEPNSPAETAELRRGDVITGIKIIVIIGNRIVDVVDYIQIKSSRDLITNLRKIPSGTPFILETNEGDIKITGTNPPANSLLISGSDIGAHFYDYKKPKNGFFSKFLPFWIEMELIWLININLILGLFNLLPLPFSDGKVILENLIGSFPSKTKSIFMKSSYLISGFLVLANLYITLFS